MHLRLLFPAAALLVANLAAGAPAVLEDERAALRKLIEEGRYAEAEAGARTLSERIEASAGAESLALADVLDVLVQALQDQGQSGRDETLLLAERSLELRERLQGPSHADVADSLNKLGRLHSMRGEHVRAQSYHERALAVCEAALGPEDPKVAQALNYLAFTRSDQGDPAGARTLLERALALHEKALGPRHPDLAKTASNLALVLDELGEYARARRQLERAASIWEEQHGGKHPVLGALLHNLAMLDWRLGDYEAAQPIAERALEIKEHALGPAHPSLATTLNLIAILLDYAGDYAGARGLFERSLRVTEEAYGPHSVELASPLANLADQLAALGDQAGAIELLERCLAIWEGGLGPRHARVALTLDALAARYLDAGQPQRAGPLFERALAIREAVLGRDHPEMAGSLDGLGDLRLQAGDVAGALALFERSLAVREQGLGPDHPALALSLERQGRAREQAGDLEAARASLERALKVREAAFGEGYPLVLETQQRLARLLVRAGRPREALDTALRSASVAWGQLRETLRSLPERQALLYAGSRPGGLDVALDLLGAGTPQALQRSREIVDAVVRSRALVLDEMAARNRSSAGEPELAPLVRALADARERLARIVVRGTDAHPPEVYGRLLADARREREQAERALAERSLPFRMERARAAAGSSEVEAALGPGDALVGYVLHGSSGSYLAFVLRPGRGPIVRHLGAAAEVDGAVRRWREAVLQEASSLLPPGRYSLESYLAAGRALRRQVWDPLTPLLAGAARVYVVPDGSLHLVSFPTLPQSGGRYLAETGPLVHRLTAERDLLADQAPLGQGLLVLGNPDYDHEASLAEEQRDGAAHPPAARPAGTGTAAGQAGGRFRGQLSRCQELGARHFEPLDQTSGESRRVADLWKASRDAQEVLLLEGAVASEAAFKEDAPGRRVVHLATHGFFLGPECRASDGSAAENPLSLSGLALAGANRRASAAPSHEDGILTAEEVAALDLGGLEWVVLSACDTGLGDVRAGEGVLGLQRAFRVAGARTVVMSLWPVEDRAGREWMASLYRRRLREGQPMSAAVHRATLDVLRGRRARGESDHPFYWGAFVAAGPDLR